VADYRELVAKIADGQEPDADQVDYVLHDAGKSLEDLREAVERLHARRRLRELVDALSGLAAERARIEKQIKAADAALEAAEDKHATTTNPLLARLRQIKDDTWAGEQATGQLHATCDDPTLLEQLAEVQTRMADARHDGHRLRTLVDDWRARARNEAALTDRAKRIVGGTEQVEEHQSRMKEAEKRVAMCQAELAKVEKAIADLERQEVAVYENMLAP
jgi:chromosome segregation ATPase